MTAEVLFTRGRSVAGRIEQLVKITGVSCDAALYRFTNRRLARALDEAQKRGVRVRLVLDRGKYQESETTRRLLATGRFAFRLTHGRDGAGSKMHHKFALLDDSVLLTGSYNWTPESEEQNYENLLVLREPELIAAYRPEFEALWAEASGT
jgi:phosphatidylserine/phosphatidylglycerophosphate/cardiolipin synthase-like enzyme